MNIDAFIASLRFKPIKKLIVFLIALIAATLVVMLVTFAVAQLIFHTNRIPPYFALFTMFPAWLVVIYLFRRYIDEESFIGMGLGLDGFLSGITVGAIVGAAFIFFIFVVNYSLGQISLKGFLWNELSGKMMGRLLLGTFFYFAAAATFEEILFRGYILQSLFELRSLWPAISLSSALFAAGHILNAGFNFLGIFNIWLFGIFACLLLLIAGNLWLPSAFHFAWNFVQGNVLGFPIYGHREVNLIHLSISGHRLLTGGSFGPEASLLTTFLLSAACAVAYLYLMKKVKEDIILGRRPFMFKLNF